MHQMFVGLGERGVRPDSVSHALVVVLVYLPDRFPGDCFHEAPPIGELNEMSEFELRIRPGRIRKALWLEVV